jgi:hypothetical protein
MPGLAHALTGVATVALADRILGKDTPADLAEVSLVNPSFRDGHDLIAVIEQEGVAVGMAEEGE